MFRCLMAIAIFAPLISYSQERPEDHGCPTSRSEKIVCGKMMCDFGLAMGEYPSECFEYERDFALMRAALAPWERMPRCYKRDEKCNRKGRAQKENMDVSYCMDSENIEVCLSAIREAEEGYCGGFDNEIERSACEEIKRTGHLTDAFCNREAISQSGIILPIRYRSIQSLLPNNPYWAQLSEEIRNQYNQYYSECMSLDASKISQ